MRKPIHRHPLLLLISIITILSIAFSITTPAYAQKDNPGKSGGGQGQGQEKSLLKLFERLQAWKTRQQLQLDDAKKISKLFQKYIDSSEDLNTAALQLQVDLYNSKIKEAESFFDLATTTLATHYGIDGNGDIYSVKSTRQMVKVASQSLGRSHRLLTSAARELQKAFFDWQATQGEGSDSSTALEPSSP